MSWAEDNMVDIDPEFMSTIHSSISRYDVDTGYWECADGKVLLISDMSDTHLINSINFCKRSNHKVHKQKMTELRLELMLRKAGV